MEGKKDKTADRPGRIRLIGADLDNTLLTRDKRLTRRTADLLEACMDRGIIFAPATGRVRTGIPDEIASLKGLRYALLANGAAVLDLETDQMIYRNGIPYEKALSLISQLNQYDTFYDFFARGSGWCEARFYDHPEKYGVEPHIVDLIHKSRRMISSMEEWLMSHPGPVEKFTLFFSDEGLRRQVITDLSADETLHLTSSLPGNLEINNFSCNKGDALIALGRHLGIAPEEIMAFGDGNNDYEMIVMAGLGVAMDNAVPEVRKAADYVTASCDEEGVAAAIEKFVLQDR